MKTADRRPAERWQCSRREHSPACAAEAASAFAARHGHGTAAARRRSARRMPASGGRLVEAFVRTERCVEIVAPLNAALLVAARRLPPSCSSSRLGRHAAFTLIELMVSTGLMALILVSGYLCLNSGILTQKLVDSRNDVLQGARVALRMMSADLRAACALSKDVHFIGIDRSIDGVEADNVDFGTHHYAPRRKGEGDFCQMSYFVGREPGSGVYALWRRQNPAFGVNPLAGGTREEILRGVRGLKFEYYDGLLWYDAWGDPDGRGKQSTSFLEKRNLTGLPEAVRITLSLEHESGASARARAGDTSDSSGVRPEPPLVFQTVARLQLSGRASGSGSGTGAGAGAGSKGGSQAGQVEEAVSGEPPP